MAIVANVNNGVLDYSYTDSSKDATETAGSDLGYDQFLQLLCAEMQYQDPLEPTTNTDYVAQMATFSQLEATLSLQQTEQNSLASALVGKQVILATETTTGNITYVEGKVDYVMYENGEVFLSVNDNLYPLSTLDTVADDSYYEAASMANTFNSMISQFPDINNLTLSYKGAVEDAREFYDGMSTYQQGFVASSDLSTLKELEERIAELQAAADASEKNASDTTDETTDTTDETTEETVEESTTTE